MGSSETITLNPALVQKIQNYMNDPVYRETVENAASYNARLSSERTMRLPFLDSQTGVAQNHSNLFMDPRQRLPGLREGQIYSYPSKRWRKKRRQYLINFMQPRYPVRTENKEEEQSTVVAAESSPFPPPSASISFNEDSRDSTKDETKPEWFYDELEMPDVGDFEEPDPDSDYDYEEYSTSRRKKKKPPAKAPRTPASRGRRKITYDAVTDPEKPFACDICGARYKTRPGLTYHYTHSHKDKEDEEDDEMVPASPKRDDAAARRRGGPASSLPPPVLHPQQMPPTGGLQPPTLQPQQLPPQHHPMHMQNPAASQAGMMMPPPPHMMHGHHPPPPHLVPQQQPPPHHVGGPPPHPYVGGPPPPPPHHAQQPPPHHQPPPPPQQQQQPPPPPPQQQQLHPTMPPTSQSNSQQPPPGPPGPPPPQNTGGPPQQPPPQNPEANSNGERKGPDNMKPRVQASTYCDFCLGDANENKKSGEAEEMVSCSDCGRSGHPSCLQFTANMIISVKKYRWQCIECKCCSICGTSDNDDQLLFCDDCDRGYHMYCLSPPLDAPPEGSWSCTLCIAEFHK
ncbi:unnamed protein product [Orchesella dallaii]|uniref:Zinc finger protein ubi-d4 n=1 Tax=Orchesella dallaii TaxID=48710 RepID=A0ABP1Q7S4_9HEXA